MLSDFSPIDCNPGPACSQTATYMPEADASGQDDFDYTATAGADTSSAATIQVNVAMRERRAQTSRRALT